MNISQDIISTIKDRIDIVDLVRKHVALKRIGGDYAGLCPFHSEKTPSFTVSPRKGFYHCFGCGAHGDQIDWMVNYHGMRWGEAVVHLAEFAGLAEELAELAEVAGGGAVSLPDNEDVHRSYSAYSKIRAAKTLSRAAQWMADRLWSNKSALRYVIEERKVAPESAKSFLLGWAPRVLQDYISEFRDDAEIEVLVQAGVLGKGSGGKLYPKLGGRVVFPIRDAAGLVIGFSGRAVGTGDAQPKYLNSPDSPFFSKRRELFRPPDLQRAARRAGRVIVTEGYFDAIALHSAGFDYAVASMGTATTEENIESLFLLTPEIVFCFDGDRSGLQAAWKALLVALPFIGSGPRGSRLASFVFLPDGLDPDEFIRQRGAEAFADLLKNATPLSSFFIESYARKRDAEPLERHAEIMAQAARQIGTIKDEVLKMSMAGKLADIFNVSVDAVRKAGGFGPWVAHNPSATPITVVRPDALETRFLVNVLRRPWEVGALPPDVELNMHGGTEIVALLRNASPPISQVPYEGDGSDLSERLHEIFSPTPYWPLVERLLASGEADDSIPINALRIELAWLKRRIEDESKSERPNADVLRELLARRVAVQTKLEQAMAVCC